jgi:hypothetical protein
VDSRIRDYARMFNIEHRVSVLDGCLLTKPSAIRIRRRWSVPEDRGPWSVDCGLWTVDRGLFNQLKEPVPADLMNEVGVAIDRKPYEERFANNVVFGYKTPVA